MPTEDGVEFAELLAPVEQKDSMLVCKKMKLGELDESATAKTSMPSAAA